MIYDYTMNKLEIYEYGLIICKQFLKLNSITFPKYINGQAEHTTNVWQTFGLYTPGSLIGNVDGTKGTIHVNVKSSALPTRVKSRRWSYPGYKVDRTAAGIAAHETGHHVSKKLAEEFLKCEHPMAEIGNYLPWREIVNNTKPVSGYEPTPDEAFAETMRVFILNPNLLRLGRPKRFKFLIDDLKLKPFVKLSWNQVLSNAPSHILDAADKFAEGK